MIVIGENVVMLYERWKKKLQHDLFDIGSARTYVVEELMNLLNLKPIEEETFSVYYF